MKTEAVSFYSEGARIAAVLYSPDSEEVTEPRAGVVLCNGFTGLKQFIVPQYAEAIADAGLVALTFDYRGFGGSDGQRGRLLWPEQAADIGNAITYLASRSEVDSTRIGLWGTSYGGALAPYVFATDDRVAACVGQLGFGDAVSAMASRMPDAAIESLRVIVEEDRRQRVLHNTPMYVDAAEISGNQEMTSYMNESAQDVPHLDRQIMAQFLEAHMQFSPVSVIRKKGERPLLLIAAELDEICPAENYRRLFDEAPEPKDWMQLDGTRHFECYVGEPASRTAAAAAEYLKKQLGA